MLTKIQRKNEYINRPIGLYEIHITDNLLKKITFPISHNYNSIKNNYLCLLQNQIVILNVSYYKSRSMKLFRSISLTAAAVCLVTALAVSSCSKSETADRRADLLALTPDDAPVTLAFSPASILKSAGAEVDGDKIAMPEQLNRLFSKTGDFKHIADMLTSANGVNYNCAVAAGGTEFGCLLFALSDSDKFKSWAKDNGMTTAAEDGYTVCYFPDELKPGIVIDNDVAWFVGTCPDTQSALKVVKSNKERADENKIAQWKIDRLTKSDVNLLINLEKYSEMMSGIFAMTMPGFNLPEYYSDRCKYSFSDLDFDGPTVRLFSEAFDAEGKSAPMLGKGTFEPIPSKALNLVKDNQIAFGFAMPEAFKKAFETFTTQGMAGMGSEYQKTVAATMNTLQSITFGISLDESTSLVGLRPSYISATAAIAYDKDRVEGMANDWIKLAENSDIKASLQNGWKAWREDSTFVMAPLSQYPDFKIHLTGRDNLALISTSAEISSDDLKDNSSLENLIGYSSIDLKKSHPVLVLANCPFGVELLFTSTDEKSEGHITLTECDTPFIEALLTFIGRL